MYLERGVRQPKISIIFEFRERRAEYEFRMNSERMPNTPTNTLESIGGVPVTPAATYVAKPQFSQKYTKIPASAHTVPGPA